MTIKVGKPDVKPDAPVAHRGHEAGERGAATISRRATCRTGARLPSARRAQPGSREPIDPRMPNLSPPRPWRRPRAARSRADVLGRGRRGRASTRRRRRSLRLAIETPGDPLARARRRRSGSRAPARATTRPSRRGSSICSATPTRWSRTLRSLLWTNRRCSCPPFTGARPWTSRPVHVRLRGRCVEVPAALADGEVPLELLFSGTVFFAAATACCRRRDLVGPRGARSGCRSRSGARRSTRTSRTAPGCGAPGRLRPAVAYRAARRCRRWEAALEELLDGARMT